MSRLSKRRPHISLRPTRTASSGCKAPESAIVAPRGRLRTRRLSGCSKGMTTGIDFWLEHGLAHVGSPETVARRLEEQHAKIGFDVFCGRHRFAEIPTEQVEKSIRLFGEKVVPALS